MMHISTINVNFMIKVNELTLNVYLSDFSKYFNKFNYSK